MTKAELLEKLLEIRKGESEVFEHMMAIREHVNEYEISLFRYEQSLLSILKELYGITDLYEDICDTTDW